MPDLDFRALREETEDATVPPEFATVEKRAVRRRTAGRSAMAAAALGTVAVVAVGFSLFHSGQATAPTGGIPAVSPNPDAYGRDVAPHVTFVDLKHGYVSYPGYEDECRIAMRHTADGGKTWSPVRVSPPVEDSRATGGCLGGPGYVGGETVIVPGPDGAIFAEQAYISFDAGETWRLYQPRNRTADAVPEGVTPVQVCLTEQECNQEYDDHLGWYDPKTGDRMVLATKPSGMDDVGTPILAADGSIWTFGHHVAKDGETPVDTSLAVSRDHGRTWHTTHLSDDAYRFETYDGRTGYLVVDGDPIRLRRTDDGGQTWHEAGTPALDRYAVKDDKGRTTDHLIMGAMYVASDNTLVVRGSKGWTASTDGGETFHPIDLPAKLQGAQPVPGGFYSLSDEYDKLFVSQDGLTWKTYQVPAFD